jgi:hypothetical protein
MTMKILDAAPREAQLVELSQKLSKALDGGTQRTPAIPFLDLDSSFLEAARAMLASLSEQPQEAFHGEIALTKQEVETYLDINPDFVESAKDMLRDFIEQTQRYRSR